MPFDKSFTTFLLLNDFLKEFLQGQGLLVPQYTRAASDSVHRWAKTIPEKLAELDALDDALVKRRKGRQRAKQGT